MSLDLSRRGFLRGLALLMAGATIDPEALLWRPKTIVTVPDLSGVFGYGDGALSRAMWSDALHREMQESGFFSRNPFLTRSL